jgi:hypothetical protein
MIARDKFFAAYKEQFGAPTAAQKAGLDRLLTFLEGDEKMTDPRYQAYALATCWRETGQKYEPVTEYGPRAYFNKYEPCTAKGKELGNKSPGDGFKYRGRGYAQITGLDNYERFELLLGVSLLEHPENALDPSVAYRILSLGLVRGMFTRKCLSHYFTETGSDWVGARHCVNGTDHDKEVGEAGQKFLTCILAASVDTRP